MSPRFEPVCNCAQPFLVVRASGIRMPAGSALDIRVNFIGGLAVDVDVRRVATEATEKMAHVEEEIDDRVEDEAAEEEEHEVHDSGFQTVHAAACHDVRDEKNPEEQYEPSFANVFHDAPVGNLSLGLIR